MARPVVVYITSSLDGFIADADGSVDWLQGAPDEDYGYAEFYRRIGAVLLGSTTYEQVIGFDIEFPYADKPCYVFTHRSDLPKAASTVEFVAEDPARFTANLKQGSGAPLWLCGGARLMTTLWDAGLVDEVMLFVQPVVLGDGVPLLMPHHARRALHLVAARDMPGGLAELHYRVLPE